MDKSILQQNGVKVSNPRKAYLPDYELKIGSRASLIPSKNEKSFGIVMTVDDKAINHLYSEPSVADYKPEQVRVVTLTGDHISAVCYNLPVEQLSGTNESYVHALYELAEKAGFPSEYLQKIKDQLTT